MEQQTSVDPDQTAPEQSDHHESLHCLLMPVCPKMLDFYNIFYALPLVFRSSKVVAVTDFLLVRSALQTLNGLDVVDIVNYLKKKSFDLIP